MTTTEVEIITAADSSLAAKSSTTGGDLTSWTVDELACWCLERAAVHCDSLLSCVSPHAVPYTQSSEPSREQLSSVSLAAAAAAADAFFFLLQPGVSFVTQRRRIVFTHGSRKPSHVVTLILRQFPWFCNKMHCFIYTPSSGVFPNTPSLQCRNSNLSKFSKFLNAAKHCIKWCN